MERERITISIKKDVLNGVDRIIDGTNIRNRSHAIESLIINSLNNPKCNNVVIMLGGQEALKLISNTNELLLSLQKSGIEKVYVAVGFLADKIKQKIGNPQDYGLKIEYIEGEGSGGVLNKLKTKFKKETFVVIEPEYSLKKDLSELYKIHSDNKAIATIFTNDTAGLNGLYYFEPEIFDYIPSGFSMLKEDIFPKLAEKGKLLISPDLQ